jgi:hypothetical protein
MADRSRQLVAAVQLANAASEIANDTSDRLIEMGQPLGLLRKDEFKTQVSMVNRELIMRLAVLNASGSVDDQLDSLAEVWNSEVCAKMPSRETGFLAANLKLLLEVAHDHVGEEAAEHLRESVLRLVNVARRTETAGRLAEVADTIANEATQSAIDSLGASAGASRSCYRDLRLSLARVATLLPAGPSSVNGHRFRDYLVRYVLPNDPATPQVMEQVYRKLVALIEDKLPEEDAKQIRAYYEDAIPCFAKYAELKGIYRNIHRYTITAVERGYQADPRHDSLKRQGIEAGRRDGAFLLEKAVQAAVISGAAAEANLHEYFRNEQVRLSKLPGGVVVEFLRGLQEQIRDYPEMVELLVGLAKAAPAYTTALKLNAFGDELATQISTQTIKQSPGYRERIGEHGLEACIRDYSVTIRGLSRWMQRQPFDVMPFREWWMRRIGKNIRNLPEAADASDLFSIVDVDGLLHAMQHHLDNEELNYATDYLHRMVNPEGRENGTSAGERGRVRNPVVTAGSMTQISYSDIGV